MSSSIGTELNALVNSTVQRALAGSNFAGGTSGATGKAPFAAELIKQFDSDADGKLDATELQSALTSPGSGGLAGTMLQNSGSDTVDALWQRAQMQSLAGGAGQADAMLKQMDAADAYQQDHKSSSNNLFDF